MRLFFIGFLVIFLLLMTYQTKTQYHVRFNSILDRITHPFDTRLRYSIADIDPRFDLSEADLIRLCHEATNIWKQGTGKDYFVYDPDARLGIHLIYDERQVNSQQRLQHLNVIEKDQHNWSEKKQQIASLKEQLARAHSMLDTKKT